MRKNTTHCMKGHRLAGNNLYIHAGRRRCVRCCTRVRRERYADPASGRKQYNKEYIDRVHHEVIVLLGGKCANPNCRWQNFDGTLGCTDERMLQVDHPFGGGNLEYKNLGFNRYAFYSKILRAHGDGYRLLCAGCNWWHRFEDF